MKRLFAFAVVQGDGAELAFGGRVAWALGARPSTFLWLEGVFGALGALCSCAVPARETCT